LVRTVAPQPLRWSLHNVFLFSLAIGAGAGMASCAYFLALWAAGPNLTVLVWALAAVLMVALVLGFMAKNRTPELKWAESEAVSWYLTALFALAAVTLATFVVYEARRTEPVLDPRVFRSAPFAGAVLTAISAFAALGGFLFLATLYLQDARDMSALVAGLHMVPMAIAMAVGAVVSSRILARSGGRLPTIAAGAGITAGSVLLSGITMSWSTLQIIVAFSVFGLGSGMVNAPITQAAVSGMPFSQAGVASGIASTSRQIGTSLGVAITGSILAANLHGTLRARFVPASHADWLLLVGCGLAIMVLGLVTNSRWALRTSEPVPHPLEYAAAVSP
jgi:predicted MFS family arabinose efflux permease